MKLLTLVCGMLILPLEVWAAARAGTAARRPTMSFRSEPLYPYRAPAPGRTNLTVTSRSQAGAEVRSRHRTATTAQRRVRRTYTDAEAAAISALEEPLPQR